MLGQVKWFNRRKHFGFIKDLDSDNEYFVHFKSLEGADKYKYLVQGEYVSFNLETLEDGKVHAVGVRGVKGGTLMYEVRAANVRPGAVEDA